MDPADPADVAEVNRLQDQMALTAGSDRPFVMPDYDKESLTPRAKPSSPCRTGSPGGTTPSDEGRWTRSAISWPGIGLGRAARQEAFYLNVDLGLPVGSTR